MPHGNGLLGVIGKELNAHAILRRCSFWCSGDDGGGCLVINLPSGDFIGNDHIMVGESDRAQKQSSAQVTFSIDVSVTERVL